MHCKLFNLNLSLILLLSLCISCGQITRNIRLGPPDREIEKLYKHAETTYNGILEGNIAGSHQNWLQAIRQFGEIVKEYPESDFADDAQYNIGLCYIWSYKILDDSPEEAIKAFEYLIKRYPESEFVDDAYYWKAYAYSLDNNYKRSIEEYEKLIRDYPKSELCEEAIARVKEFRTLTSKSEDQKAKEYKPPDIPKPEDTAKKSNEAPKQSLETSVEEKHTQKVLKPEKRNGLVSVKDIRFHSGREFTRVVLDLTGSVKYSWDRLKQPDRIFVDLQNTVIETAKRDIEVNDGVIELIRVSQFDRNTTRLVLDIKLAQTYIVFHLKNPDRVVIDIYGSRGTGILPPKLSKSPSSEGHRDTPLVKQLGLKVKTVVIDPGHGGEDPGAVSKSGAQEKILVLDVSRQLKKILESDGNYQVYLTRDDDTFVELEKRTAFANEKGADIFISVHINSSENLAAQGIETYYLSMASDDEARATAALENASSSRTISELNSILRYILHGAKIEESRELARTAQSRLVSYTGEKDRGVKRAPFIVLIGSNSPSILVELGFISNNQDENLLRSQEYRDKLAQALAEAIEAYIKTIS